MTRIILSLALLASLLPAQGLVVRRRVVPAGGGGISFVGSAAGNNCGQFSAGTTTCVITYSPTAGHALFVGVGTYATTPASVSVADNAAGGSSTWTCDINDYDAATPLSNDTMALCRVFSVKAGVTQITVTFAANQFSSEAILLDFTGPSIFDSNTAAVKNATSTTLSTNSVTPGETGALSLGLFFTTGAAQAVTGTDGWNCYTATNGDSFVSHATGLCYKLLPSTSPVSAAASITTSNFWAAYQTLYH